jgi:hypothetical protein
MVYPVTEKQIFDLLDPYRSGADNGDLTLETRLFADLGIDGDDGHELLDSFASGFSVDMTGVNSFCYFDDEPPKVMHSELTLLLGLMNDRFRAYVEQCLAARREITVGDLYVSARLRRWDFPDQGRVDAVFETWREVQLKQLIFHVVGGLLLIAAAMFFESWNLSLIHVAVILALLWLASALIRFGLELRWLRRLCGARKAAEKHV